MGTIEESLVGINDHMTQEGNTIQELINSRGCIKHVQRGYGYYKLPLTPTSGIDYTRTGSLKIPITHCNPDKSVLLIMCNDNNASSLITSNTKYIKWELSSDNIIIYAQTDIGSISLALIWQIIEFY